MILGAFILALMLLALAALADKPKLTAFFAGVVLLLILAAPFTAGFSK